jgi:hypothetical protein
MSLDMPPLHQEPGATAQHRAWAGRRDLAPFSLSHSARQDGLTFVHVLFS